MMHSLLESSPDELQFSGLVFELLTEHLVLLSHAADLPQLLFNLMELLLLFPHFNLLLVNTEQITENVVSSWWCTSTHVSTWTDLVSIQSEASSLNILVVSHPVGCGQISTQQRSGHSQQGGLR